MTSTRRNHSSLSPLPFGPSNAPPSTLNMLLANRRGGDSSSTPRRKVIATTVPVTTNVVSDSTDLIAIPTAEGNKDATSEHAKGEGGNNELSVQLETAHEEHLIGGRVQLPCRATSGHTISHQNPS